MNEEELLSEIAHQQSMVALEKISFQDKVKPYQAKLYDLTATYSKLFSPLKAGDVIEYTPYGAKYAGIVSVKKANCLDIPDKWEYQVEVLSVGNSPEKRAVGNLLWINISRSDTPKKINNAPDNL